LAEDDPASGRGDRIESDTSLEEDASADDGDARLRPFWADEGIDSPASSGSPSPAGITVVLDPDAARPPDDPAEVGPPIPDPDANEFGVSPMEILGTQVMPATRERLSWTTGQSFSGSVMETPVVVVHGLRPGPRLCLTAGV